MNRLRLARSLPVLIQTASGVTAIVLGLIVVVGWQTGSSTLIQLRPGLAAMQYVNALAFMIAGVGLLSAVSHRDGVAGIAGLLIAAIGLLSLVQDLLYVNPEVDLVFGVTAYLTAGAVVPARMPPNAALLFGLVGAALFMRRAGGAARMSMITSLLGSATAALGLVAVVGYASDLAPAYGWGRLTRMAVHTAAGFVAVGAGLVARGWRDSAVDGGAARRIPVLVGVASLTVTIAVWHALVVHDRQRTFELVRTQALYTRALVAGPFEAEARALQRTAHQWAAAPASQDEWTADALQLLRQFEGYETIEWVDATSGQHWAVPFHAGGSIAHARDHALRTAAVSRAAVVTQTIDLNAGTNGVLLIVPTTRGGAVGVIRFDRLMKGALTALEGSGYQIALFDGVRPVHGTIGPGDVSHEWIAEVDLGIAGSSLRLRAWPTSSRLAQLEGRMSSLILAGGLLLSGVLTCMTSFAATIRRRERQLGETAIQLREQMKEREVVESALRESEERYRSLIDSATDIIYRVDPDGRFTFVNPVATRVMNRTQSELIGLHFLELVHPEWRSRVAQFYADQVGRREAQTYFELPAIAGDGTSLWIGQNVQLLVDRDVVIGLQAVARDITERKRADAEIAKARDAALESDRLKSEFVANVSHELRTPMNGILGLTEMLLETDLTAEQRDHAAMVRDCGETLLTLLNDILDLSKVAAGKLEIQMVAFEPRHLVQQTADLFAERARRKGVDLVCLVRHDVPETVLGDPGRCRQILTNLLGNAVKFTDRGEITVRATCDQCPDGQILLRVEVTDTGIGVSPEAQAQIFQPFVQADGSITRKYGGTGLGLVISRQLAELMGGEMGLISQTGQGSTFWFTVRATPASTTRLQRGAADSVLSGVRALALDDSSSSRQRRRQLLERWGMIVRDEGTADAALRALKAAADSSEPFDVLLVELRDLGTNPFDFAAAVHASGLVPRLRMILISGRGQPGDAQRARELGACAYLTKPISPLDLLECLTTVMGTAANAGASAAEPVDLVTRYTLENRHAHVKATLLVVEDNVVNQKVLVGFLAKLGYRADIATNGLEALEALQRASYPLVLMDSQMPQMDGFATTAEIRRREAGNGRTVIVAVTAHAMKGERERCLAAGMDDYLSKPISLDRLSAILERWLSDSETAEGSSPDASLPDSLEGDPAIDPSVLSRLRELETDVPGLLTEVLTAFLRDTPGRIEGLLRAIENADCVAAEAAAHGLKGSAGAVGAPRLAELCRQIEECSRRGALSDGATSAAALAGEYRRVRAILQRDYLPVQMG